MARKKTQKPAVDATATVDATAIEKASAVRDAESMRLTEIDAQFSTGQPYDMHRIIDEARFYLQQSAESMLQAGSRLVLLKEHETHGEFQAALENIGIAPRAAQKMMQAAVKFSNAPTLAHLGKSKILELMTEGDDDLSALAEGETLAGHTLDDIERMSARELRDSLRKARKERAEQSETSDRMLADKNKKIDALDAQIHRRESGTAEECATEVDQSLTAAARAVMGSILEVERIINEAINIEGAPKWAIDSCAQTISRLAGRVQELQQHYPLDDLSPQSGDEDWMVEAREETGA